MAKEWSKQVFSKNLQRYISASGKTQKELADAIGVSAPTFNEWVSGKKFPRIDKIQKLADYFGVLKSDLIEDKDTPVQQDERTSEVIRLFGSLDQEHQETLLHVLRGLLADQKTSRGSQD